MNPEVTDILIHYGTKRHSGRYPWGSGDDPYQHGGDFLSRVDEMRAEGFTFTDDKGQTWTGDTAIAKSMGMSTTQFRTEISIENERRRQILVDKARSMREHGYSLNQIAAEMGFNSDSSVRALLNSKTQANMRQAKVTADYIKSEVDKKGLIDIGAGVELEMGISEQKLKVALSLLEKEGYETRSIRVPQATNPGQWTTVKVISPPGTEYRDLYKLEDIHSLKDYRSHDGGDTFDPTWVYPESMNSSRLSIRYAEDGGRDKDGVVEIRRGVDDLSLGGSTYSQVRILVDGSKYIKGMAVYGDDKDFPPGVDVIFNTNKSKSVPKMEVLKSIKKDPDNPFGSLIKDGVYDPDDPDSYRGGQSYYYDKDGNKHLSLINKRADEGDWGEWSRKLPAQFLVKQNKKLIETQLDLTKADRSDEFDEICSLTNPTVKRVLLDSFADDCDSAAVHLKAAALPRQQYQVILPLTSIKDNEVYAPNYKDGETVALVRFPHGGTFEIPTLVVNNRNKEGRRVLGTTPVDAIGISSAVADRLSGADFDGDTVMVIPFGKKVHITSTPELRGLKGFDPKLEYGPDSSDPVRVIDKQGRVWDGEAAKGKTGIEYYSRNGKMYKNMGNTQIQMGIVSNLITDMTLRGATPDELAQAVRHSMVVIDAEKHHLDYRQSAKDNNITSLKHRYQGDYDEDGRYHEGASTLISKAKAEVDIEKRKGSPRVNQKGKPWYDPDKPEGTLVYKTVHEEYVDKSGKTRVRTSKSTQMAETSDAYTLISDKRTRTDQEILYADYANYMKTLANKARLESIATGRMPYSTTARSVYDTEVKSLRSKLNNALRNAPRERQAQIIANVVAKAKIESCSDITKEEKKKVKQQALTQARLLVGAKRYPIEITDREWEAIQAGAISDSVLEQILKKTDIDAVRQRATPRSTTTLSPAKITHIQRLQDSGYTTAEIAKSLGVSATTVTKYLNGKG